MLREAKCLSKVGKDKSKMLKATLSFSFTINTDLLFF